MSSTGTSIETENRCPFCGHSVGSYDVCRGCGAEYRRDISTVGAIFLALFFFMFFGFIILVVLTDYVEWRGSGEFTFIVVAIYLAMLWRLKSMHEKLWRRVSHG